MPKQPKTQPWFKNPFAPLYLILPISALTATILNAMGRFWTCTCGYIALWVSNPISSENSQQIADPYSFTHVEHGLALAGVVWLLARKLSWQWRLVIVIALESLWEILENSPWIINRYRAETISLGYEGDTILNSFSDILACTLGFLFVKKFGWKWSLALFVVIELLLAFTIRDNLTTNLIMLIYPLKAVKAWQVGL